MKRILILACLAGLLAGPAWALDVTPLQIGIAGTKAQLFPATTKVMGLRLNLACSDNQDVLGVDVGLVGLGQRMDAIQLNLVNKVDAEFAGISAGLFSQMGSVAGVQAGLFNSVQYDLNGFQLGLFNNADNAMGIQFGLINRAVTLRGIQIGLVNLIEEGPVTFFPILNAAF